MNGREMTRILVEGALNGIGFVIGSALVGWSFLHQGTRKADPQGGNAKKGGANS
jgi:hypothetical protein